MTGGVGLQQASECIFGGQRIFWYLLLEFDREVFCCSHGDKRCLMTL